MERVETVPTVQVELEPGRGLLVKDLGVFSPSDGGCILELTLRLDQVCPETRTALAVTLTELDGDDQAYPRGIRTLLVPAHHGTGPAGRVVEPIRFPLPRELDVSGGGTRRFQVQVDVQCVDCHSCCRLRA